MSDLIERDKAINILETIDVEIIPYADIRGYVQVAIDHIRKELDAQPTIEVPTWIPCSERLPSDSNIVLIEYKVLYAGKWERGYSTTRYINGRFIGYDYDETEVIAWQPIQPYREGE